MTKIIYHHTKPADHGHTHCHHDHHNHEHIYYPDVHVAQHGHYIPQHHRHYYDRRFYVGDCFDRIHGEPGCYQVSRLHLHTGSHGFHP